LYNLEVRNRLQALTAIECFDCSSECVQHEHVEQKWGNSKTPSIAQQKRWLSIDVDHVKKDGYLKAHGKSSTKEQISR